MQISKTFVRFDQAFATSSEPLSGFFEQAGIGYYIPLYQREYSWDTENVDQLMEDLCQGVDMLLEKDDSILFMGTIILLTESNPQQNIKPKDQRAIPSRVDNVIDGQQRISTFALLSTLIYARLTDVNKNLKKAADKAGLDDETRQEVRQLENEIESQLAKLLETFSVDLRRGQPKVKPIIIRGSVDCWTLDGADDQNYISEVARHLANAIRSIETNQPITIPKEASQVKRNLRRMNEHLDKVIDAYKEESEDFPAAWKLLNGLPEETIWTYPRPKLAALITHRSNPLTSIEERLCSAVQLLAFTNFLLNRCCFTIIRPTAEAWAFDMFQSLNATGTPLTAIETFKPMVSNYASINGGYKGSRSEIYFSDVDKFLGQARSANQKNKVTNDFLTTFALIEDGRKLPSQFSAQRRFLEEQYESCKTAPDREAFMQRMSDLADYRRLVSDITIGAATRIPGTENAPQIEQELAMLCIAYLKKANHKMADTILCRFYSLLHRADPTNKAAARDEFIGVCKALTAFYTLWRSASSNSGLDDVYRKMLRNSDRDSDDGLSWKGNPSNLTLSNLKMRLIEALVGRNVGTKPEWNRRAEVELRYGNGVDPICRLAILIAAHDTVPDPTSPGLISPGQKGVQAYLRLEKWLAEDLSTIEHIAPQTPMPSVRLPWNTELYEDECYQRIGNLTLLPTEINSSAGNKGWSEKYLYYKYLVVQNPAVERPLIMQEAEDNGINLRHETISMLEDATHSAHIRPIVKIGMTGSWDRAIVERRSQVMCDLLWDAIYPWLS